MGHGKKAGVVAESPVRGMQRRHILDEAAVHVLGDRLGTGGDECSGHVTHQHCDTAMAAAGDVRSASDDRMIDRFGEGRENARCQQGQLAAA
jgi:hypothetical protein